MTGEAHLTEGLRRVLTDPAHRLDPELVDLGAVHRRADQRRRRSLTLATSLTLAVAVVAALVAYPRFVADPPPAVVSPSPTDSADVAAGPTCGFDFLQPDLVVRGSNGMETWLIVYYRVFSNGYADECVLREPTGLIAANGYDLRPVVGPVTARPDDGLQPSNRAHVGDYVGIVIQSDHSACLVADDPPASYPAGSLSLQVGGTSEPIGAGLDICQDRVRLSGWFAGTPKDLASQVPAADLRRCTADDLLNDIPMMVNHSTLYVHYTVLSRSGVGCLAMGPPQLVYAGPGAAPRIVRAPGMTRRFPPITSGEYLRDGSSLTLVIQVSPCTSGKRGTGRSYSPQDFELVVDGQTLPLVGPSVYGCEPVRYNGWLTGR